MHASIGAEILVLADGAEARLNNLQATWAKTILGARRLTDVRGSLAVAECGWKLRLGTAMLEKAVLFYNKVLLLPSTHPTRMMLTLALLTPCDTWASRVQSIMRDQRLPHAVPDIISSGIMRSDEKSLVISDPAIRRNVLRRYKWQILRPAFLHVDSQVFTKDATKLLPGLDTTYACLGCYSMRSLSSMLVSELPWVWIRAWYLVKLTGIWPLGLFSAERGVVEVPCCKHCKAVSIKVRHMLGECPEGRRRPTSATSVEDLFCEQSDHNTFLRHVAYVGSQIEDMLKWMAPSCVVRSEPDSDTDADRLRVWAWDLQGSDHD